MYFIGIDPGVHGGIAILRQGGEILELLDMPIVKLPKGKKTKDVYDLNQIQKIVSFWNNEYYACMEKMQSMPPGFRVQASFGLGYCQGLFEGMFRIRQLKYEMVISKKWQKHFGITQAKGDKKVQSYMIASQLFPDAELTGPRGGKKDGRSDALLIAEWGRRHVAALEVE